ncbi:MAG: ATP-dependent helicase [Candidatus Liptonbacteria bacterium]|nr:ATP-dependent helicase [Candidatus Liptonbacteria bacterium]
MDTHRAKQFNKRLAALNAEQRSAVDAIEGPVMVIAGPGTGKTETLALRIANILLNTQTHPSGVLALTFTDSGVAAMRTRLIELIGTAGYYVNVFTFHSFCNDVIQRHQEEFPEHVGRTHCGELERVRLFEELIRESADIALLKPFGEPLYYLRAVMQGIGGFKRDGVSVEAFERLVRRELRQLADAKTDARKEGAPVRDVRQLADWEHELAKNEELLVLYRRYQERLAAMKRYDYDDMILFVVGQMERSADFLLRLQEQYQYILVDEHQDTNRGQNRVVELLGNFHDRPNLFVVGDERQAIYAFQGASLENFLGFVKTYPTARVVNLTRNYRSVQPILDATNGMITHNALSVSDYLAGVSYDLRGRAAETDQKAVCLLVHDEAERECDAIAKRIGERVAAGTRPEEIAVIFRENSEAQAVGDALRRQGIPFIVESDRNVLDDRDMRALYRILAAVAAPPAGGSAALADVMMADIFAIPLKDAAITFQWSERTRKPLIALLSDADACAREGIGDALRAFGVSFARWVSHAANNTAEEAFIAIMNESGWLSAVARKPTAAETLTKLRALFRELRNLTSANPTLTVNQFVEYLDAMQTHGVPIREPRIGAGAEAVRLMTAHRSKGLEFDHVYVPNVIDGVWGGRRNRDLLRLPRSYYGTATSAPIVRGDDDERRLLYVALTRARHGVELSWARIGADGRERVPSKFLGELGLPAQAGVPEETVSSAFPVKDPVSRFRMHPPVGVRERDHAVIRELFQRQGLSATAVNNYLVCPLRYFYANLIRLPRKRNESQEYGTAVHAVLKFLFSGTGRTSKAVVDRFLAEAKARGLGERWITRGSEHLAQYHNRYAGAWHTNVLTEVPVRAMLGERLPGQGIRISGKLDKIELFAGGEANVVDYKTGTPKSRNDIEGKTKSSDGGYKRQLVFYKLLLDLVPLPVRGLAHPVRMVSGEIDFVEPAKNGKFRKERFAVSDAETNELRERITAIADDITSMKFLGQGCGDRRCEYCALGLYFMQ